MTIQYVWVLATYDYNEQTPVVRGAFYDDEPGIEAMRQLLLEVLEEISETNKPGDTELAAFWSAVSLRQNGATLLVDEDEDGDPATPFAITIEKTNLRSATDRD